MMKKIALAALLFTFAAAPAMAGEAYIGINAGQNKMDIADAQSSRAFSGILGYAFNQYVAEEVAYAYFTSADTNLAGVSLWGDAASLSVVGSLPLGSDFSLFAKLGYATTRVEATGGFSETRGDVTYGAGAQYNATKNVGIRLGYDRYRVAETVTTTTNSGFVSLGAIFKF